MIAMSVKGLDEAMRKTKEDQRKVFKAAKFTMSRVQSSTLTEASRLIRGEYNINNINLLNKASGNSRIQAVGKVTDDLTATISFLAGGISLVYFGAVEYRRTSAGLTKRGRKGTTAIKRGKIGVKVQIEKGKTTRLRQFFAGVKFGKGSATGIHLGVFRRLGKERFPIAESAVISPASMINKPDIMKPLTQFVQDTFTTRFNHELKRLGVTN